MNLTERYNELYQSMATSKNPQKMMLFGEAEKWAFATMAKDNPAMAEHWLTKLEAGEWRNYISQAEYRQLTEALVSQNGSRGPHWTYDQIRQAVESLGAQMEKAPQYNCYALALTMNMLWSDHAESAAAYVPPENHVPFFFSQAVEKLTDKDRPEFIRQYFNV